jgi:hypothetical protein
VLELHLEFLTERADVWSSKFEAPKIWFQTFQKIMKKYHGVGNVVFYQCVVFQIKNAVFWAQQKKKEILPRWTLLNSAYRTWFCLFVRFCNFYWAQNTTYFVPKIYRMVECNIAYVMVLFSDFFFNVYIRILYTSKKKKRNRHPGARAPFGVFGW